MDAALDRLSTYADELLAACREQVRQQPVTRFGPVNASGQLAEGLRTEVLATPTGYRLNLYAPAYVLTLLYGRRPGAFPPLLQIEQWIVSKGIVPRPDAKGRVPSTRSLAYLIGRKLAQKGNVIYQQGPPSALFADKLAPGLVAQELAKLLLPAFTEEVRSALRLAA